MLVIKYENYEFEAPPTTPSNDLVKAQHLSNSKTNYYTLPETNIAMENPPCWWYLPGNVWIFYGYVSLTEGKSYRGSPWYFLFIQNLPLRFHRCFS